MGKKLTSTCNDALQVNQNPLENIENLILNVRGKQVMLDRDLARLYGVETKVLNQAVKRNVERFPDDFMFQITKEEVNRTLFSRSQFVTLKEDVVDSESNSESRSQNSTLKTTRGENIKYLPYAFTENGIAMLSSVLRSSTAIQVNIHIMRAFVSMRRFLYANRDLYNRIETLEYNQLVTHKLLDDHNEKFNSILNSISKYELPKQNIFFDGQLFDAHILISTLIESAENRIVLIDNYIDESVLMLLSKRKANVSAKIYTLQVSRTFRHDLQSYNSQYPPIDVVQYTKAHDRFLIIDDKVYHVGASIKDLGKKLCAVSLLTCINANEMLNRIV